MGRAIIIVLATAGLLPLLGDAKALDATTVSGTIVLGLGPPIFVLMFVDGYRPLTFHLPFWWCATALSCPLSGAYLSVHVIFPLGCTCWVRLTPQYFFCYIESCSASAVADVGFHTRSCSCCVLGCFVARFFASCSDIELSQREG